MKTSPLLSEHDPKYCKRLVRELNTLPDGFYHSGHRYIRARFKGDCIEGRFIRECGCAGWTALGTGQAYFSDAYGRHVVANRAA